MLLWILFELIDLHCLINCFDCAFCNSHAHSYQLLGTAMHFPLSITLIDILTVTLLLNCCCCKADYDLSSSCYCLLCYWKEFDLWVCVYPSLSLSISLCVYCCLSAQRLFINQLIAVFVCVCVCAPRAAVATLSRSALSRLKWAWHKYPR